MSLSLRNRQFAGNICLIVFLAFMFTLLPGQLFTDNAYATVPPVELATDYSDNAGIADAYETYTLFPVSDETFSNTIQDLINNLINQNSNGTTIHKVTYQKVYSGETLINWLVYLIYDNVDRVAYDVKTWVYDDTSNPTKSVAVKVWRPPTSGGSSSTGANDDTVSSGTISTTTVDGRTTTILTVDSQKLEQQLANAGSSNVVTLSINTTYSAAQAMLTGQMVQGLQDKEAVLKIKTNFASYTLPASEINIAEVAKELGALSDLNGIQISIKIDQSNQAAVKVIQDAAKNGEFTVVAPPVNFEVTCSYKGKAVDVSKFNTYVERSIPIPDGVDPSKITTGIVLNADGTFSHVPTSIKIIDGKYYAVINSLTNSTYSVIYNPITFKDVEKHWAKAAVNDLGSRLIINGIDKVNFAPDKNITRAEFAAIVVRSLGLGAKGTTTKFSDVKETYGLAGAISKAAEYGVINGYTDGTFKPEKQITRAEAMAIIVNAMKVAGLDVSVSKDDIKTQLSKFKDSAQVASWVKNSVASSVKQGLLVGQDGKLNLGTNITRAETATIVQRLLKKAKLI